MRSVRLLHTVRRAIPLSLTARALHTNRPGSGLRSLLPLVHSASNLVVSLSTDHLPLISTRISTGLTSFETTSSEFSIPFFASSLNGPPLGLLRPSVMDAFVELENVPFRRGSQNVFPWRTLPKATRAKAVTFAPDLDEESRTWAINTLARRWKVENRFQEILQGWSDESYPVYHTVPTSENLDAPSPPLAFSVERAALPLFGFPNYGCLLIAYFHSPQIGKLMLWVPRRSVTKRTWPGRLDVTVGGGMGTGESARSTIVRECAEEASLDPVFVRRHLRPVGRLAFLNRSPSGWILPGFYYLFELPLPPDESVQPRTNVADGEVESFELMDVDNVLENLYAGMFKPSSALAVVQFLMRQGVVTENTEPEFARVCAEMDRQVYPYTSES